MTQQRKKKIFTVTFDSTGGSRVSSQTVKRGEKATSVTPDRAGYRFTGWTLAGELYDFSLPVTRDIVLTAVWEIMTYTVTFDSRGGSAVPVQTVTYGGNATNATPTRDSYTFAGWTLNGTIFDFNTPVTGDIILVASWQYAAQLRTQSGVAEVTLAKTQGGAVIMRHFGIKVTFPVPFVSEPSVTVTLRSNHSNGAVFQSPMTFTGTPTGFECGTGMTGTQGSAGVVMSGGQLSGWVDWTATGYY